MEQKEVVHKYYVLGTSTLDKILRVLNNLSTDTVLTMKDKHYQLHGEENLYKMMSRSDPLTSAFLNEKVNLNKLKDYLTEQGLPFAFKETDDGTNLFFRVKDQELAKKALENVINGIKKDPKIVLKKPDTMTFEEKIEYAKKVEYKNKIGEEKSQTKGRKM